MKWGRKKRTSPPGGTSPAKETIEIPEDKRETGRVMLEGFVKVVAARPGEHPRTLEIAAFSSSLSLLDDVLTHWTPEIGSNFLLIVAGWVENQE